MYKRQVRPDDPEDLTLLDVQRYGLEDLLCAVGDIDTDDLDWFHAFIRLRRRYMKNGAPKQEVMIPTGISPANVLVSVSDQRRRIPPASAAAGRRIR